MAERRDGAARKAAAQEPARPPAPARTRPTAEPGDATEGAGGALALDRVIHERMRLGIVSALAVNASLTFVDLKGLLRTTDGNLSVHARKLEEAGYVICEKSFQGRVPITEYRLAPAGRRALEKYLAHMEAIITAAKAASE